MPQVNIREQVGSFDRQIGILWDDLPAMYVGAFQAQAGFQGKSIKRFGYL